MLLKKLNRKAEMLDALKNAVTNDDYLIDYALFELSNYYYKNNNYQEASKYLMSLIDKYPDSLIFERATLMMANIQLKYNKPSYAANFLGLIKSKTTDPESAYNFGEMYSRINNPNEALEFYMQVVRLNHNNSYKTKALKKICELFNNKTIKNKSELALNLIKKLLMEENTVDASKLTSHLPAGPEQYFYKGIVEFNSNNFTNAAQIFKSVIDKYPRSPLAIQSEFYRAACGLKIKSNIVSEMNILKFIEEHPYNDMADNAYFALAEYYMKTGKTQKGLECLARIRNSYPNNDAYFDALWLESEYYYKNKDFQRAAEVYSVIVKMTGNKDDLIKSLYWRGKSYENESEYGKASLDFIDVATKSPMSFYSYRAFSKLKLLKNSMTRILNSDVSGRSSNRYSDIIPKIDNALSGNLEGDKYIGYYRLTNKDFREFDYTDIDSERFPNQIFKTHFYKYYILKSLKEFDYAAFER